MLLVKTTIAPSAIQGLGLFAAEPIAKDAIIWELHPWIDVRFTPAQVESLPALCREKVSQQWGYLHKSGMYILCTDGAQFMNHGHEPNVIELDNEESGNVMVAARDIAANEELTCDYRGFDEISRTQGLGF
jgi:SET domain-containing protein